MATLLEKGTLSEVWVNTQDGWVALRSAADTGVSAPSHTSGLVGALGN